MTSKEYELRSALAKIVEMINALDLDEHKGGAEATSSADDFGCTLKSLPDRLLLKAAETAVRINPINGPARATIGADFQVTEPLRMAVVTTKYWGPSPRRLTVSFMESTPTDLQKHIIGHMNAWTQTGCISFVPTSGTGNVRISRGPGGYYSYLGTDILHIPSNRQTMNLQGFTMSTPESEYRRVVRHETGHTLGAPHEHMRKALVARIDPQKAYAYFLRTQGWNKAMVDAQVLTPLDEASLMSTPPDQDSIMCYQLPGSITRDGLPIRGGTDINPTDFGFIGKIYPKPHSGLFDPHLADETAVQQDDWPESVDPEVSA